MTTDKTHLAERVFLTPAEASAYLRTLGVIRHPKSLAKDRVTGKGPLFRKTFSRVVYEQGDLRRWAAEHLGPLMRSNSG